MAVERPALPVRVLLADDEALVRDGLQMLLDNEPGIEVVGSPTWYFSTSGCPSWTVSRPPGR